MAAMDAKHDKLLRALQKQHDNKRCFNCDSLGTTYTVPQFNIFVCTDCSGVHMQVGQRVKSVSMAKFTPDEMRGLQEGGNDAAARLYLGNWRPDGAAFVRKPTDRNKKRVEEWIQVVFKDKKYYSETPSSNPGSARVSADGSAASLPPVLSGAKILGRQPSIKVMDMSASNVSTPRELPPEPAPAPPPRPAPPAVSLLDGGNTPPAAAAPSRAMDAWAAFEAPGATTAAPRSAAQPAAFDPFASSSQPAARAAAPPAPTPAAAGGGWAAFDAPAAALAAPQPGLRPIATSAAPPGGFVAAAVAGAAPTAADSPRHRKLPSDLFGPAAAPAPGPYGGGYGGAAPPGYAPTGPYGQGPPPGYPGAAVPSGYGPGMLPVQARGAMPQAGFGGAQGAFAAHPGMVPPGMMPGPGAMYQPYGMQPQGAFPPGVPSPYGARPPLPPGAYFPPGAQPPFPGAIPQAFPGAAAPQPFPGGAYPGALHPQQQPQQQLQPVGNPFGGGPAVPAPARAEDMAFADLLDVKRALPRPAAPPAFSNGFPGAYGQPPQQQQQQLQPQPTASSGNPFA